MLRACQPERPPQSTLVTALEGSESVKFAQAASVVAVFALASGCASEPTGVAASEVATGRRVAGSQLADKASGDHFYASSERFGYYGTVSVFGSWADAKSGRNARCTDVAWPQRDGAIFVVRNAPEYYVDNNVVLTNWFANNGASPSDQNEGFTQLYDEDADTWQNQSAFWSKDLASFTVRVKGRNATYGSALEPKDYARLWNACAPAGSGEATTGTFLTYDYELVASGLDGVEGPKGFITNSRNATDYRGHFRGIFRNESATSPTSNGYYVFELRFNNVSWAAACNCGYGGTGPNGGPTAPDAFGGERRR